MHIVHTRLPHAYCTHKAASCILCTQGCLMHIVHTRLPHAYCTHKAASCILYTQGCLMHIVHARLPHAYCTHMAASCILYTQGCLIQMWVVSTPLGSQSEHRLLRRSVVASGSALISCLPYFFMFTSACIVADVHIHIERERARSHTHTQ